MATHSGTLAWEIPRMEEPGGLRSMGSQRVRHDLATEQHPSTLTNTLKQATARFHEVILLYHSYALLFSILFYI